MSLMGPQAFEKTALDCHRKANALRQRLLTLDGVWQISLVGLRFMNLH